MILGIETAVERVGVAVGDSRGVVAAASLTSDRRHAESLTPMIRFILDQAGLSMRDLSAIAVDAGPGLFTGMRVGISAAEALAWALEIPVVGVCSLDVVAMNAPISFSTPVDTVAVALDARRGEVYWALYSTESAQPVRLSDPVVGLPDDLAIHLADRAEDVLCVGSGFHRYSENFEAPWMHVLGADHGLPSAENVVRLGLAHAAIDDDSSLRQVQPIYLRAPDAEINWQTREVAR